jgi:hypothetical protein
LRCPLPGAINRGGWQFAHSSISAPGCGLRARLDVQSAPGGFRSVGFIVGAAAGRGHWHGVVDHRPAVPVATVGRPKGWLLRFPPPYALDCRGGPGVDLSRRASCGFRCRDGDLSNIWNFMDGINGIAGTEAAW